MQLLLKKLVRLGSILLQEQALVLSTGMKQSSDVTRKMEFHRQSSTAPVHAKKARVVVDIQVHTFLTLALDGNSQENRRLGQAGHFGEQRNFLPLTAINPLFLIIQPAV
jgi:hypothetical protein